MRIAAVLVQRDGYQEIVPADAAALAGLVGKPITLDFGPRRPPLTTSRPRVTYSRVPPTERVVIEVNEEDAA